jgi:multiple sugar transport system permease protein
MAGESRNSRLATYAAVFLVALLVLLPIYWMVNMSFKDKSEFTQRPPTLIVERPTLANYRDLLVAQRFDKYGYNSVVVALIASTVAVTCGSLAAYGLSRFRLPRNFNYHLLFTVLTVRMFPPIVTVIPIFLFYHNTSLPGFDLGPFHFGGYSLEDSRLGLGLVHAFTELPLVIWIMIGFFRDLPRDMEDAALVDGDSRLGVMRKIALPLARPGLAATFILVFISSWNEFLLALILTQSKAKTLPLAVASQITQYDVKYGNLMAAGVLTTVPVMVLALLAQRHLTRGLTVGGVTG